MFDHLTLTVSNLPASAEFYALALAPLGYSKQLDFGEMLGFGSKGKPAFWLKQGGAPQSPLHLAFRSRDRKGVDGFHAAALGAGARDDGPPGLRTHYHPNYYGAFVIDPDGHHVEAVCHLPLAEITVSERPKARKAKKPAPRRPKARARGTKKRRA